MATIKGNSGNNNLMGTTDNDFIYGYDGQDTLTGLAGNDRLEAGNGNDTLDGGIGADTMIGGSGDDTYIVDNISDVITEVPGEGVDTIKTSISYTLKENYVNNLILTGSGNLNGTGNSYDNVITGNAGNNTLKGNAGKDTINGGNGTDTLIGGTGDDTYIVDSTTDVIVEVPGEGVDTVISSVSYTLGENYLNNLTLTGGENNLSGTGNSYDNVIAGNDSNNLLFGGDGNDSIRGYLGYDSLYGEKGNDLLSYGYFSDYDVSNLLDGGDGDDTLEGGLNYDTLYGGNGNDVLSGGSYIAGSVYMYGGNGNDTLTGRGELYGDGGNDVLDILPFSLGSGGLGNDTLTCYHEDAGYLLGSTIVFNAANEGTDTILDFESGGADQISISASGFGGGLTQNSYLSAAQFKYGSSATTASQRFLYDTSTGYLRFDVDGSGSAAATVLAILQGAPTLTVNDFYVS